jgi:hypothetical protein
VRVLIWNTYYGSSFGGSETTVDALLRTFDREGVTVTLVTSGSRSADAPTRYFPQLPSSVEVHVDSFPMCSRVSASGELLSPTF